MKIRRTIYLVLAILFIFLNIFLTILSWEEIAAELSKGPEGIGYLIGTQIFLYAGLSFLYAYRKVQKKIARKEQEALENSFLQDFGNNQ